MSRRTRRSITSWICAIALTPIGLAMSGCEPDDEGAATSSTSTSPTWDALSPIQDPARTSILDDIPVYPDATKVSDRLIEETATRSFQCNSKEVTEDTVREHLHEALQADGWTQGETQNGFGGMRYVYTKESRRLTLAFGKDDLGMTFYTLYHPSELTAQ